MAAKVTIGIPSGDMVHADFARCLAAVTYKEAIARREFSLAWVKGSLVAVNRNECVKLAQQANATHLLFWDTDITATPDTIGRLLARDKPAVGATYCARTPPHTPHVDLLPGQDRLDARGCIEVAGLPTGLLLIRMEVFAQLKEPWFQTPAIIHPDTGQPTLQGEDVFFSQQMRKAGFSMWLDADLSLDVAHLGQQAFGLGQ